MNNQEVWLPIRCYEGYMISNHGRVKSLARLDSRGNKLREKILKQHVTIHGYSYVSLYKDGKAEKKRVHRLVASTFIPNPEGKEEVNHIDGDKINNFAENLEWSTRTENNDHAYVAGLNRCIGQNHHQAKLSEEQVIDIFKRVGQGENGSQIAREYGINKTTVSAIKLQKKWKSVTQKIKKEVG